MPPVTNTQAIQPRDADQPTGSAWMLLGGAGGIKLTQSMWRVLGLSAGEVSIAVPVGSVVGALVAALLGLISNPRLLVLLMAVFAGSTAGAVAGKLSWRDVGEIGGQVAGGLVGGITWAVWLFVGAGKAVIFDRERMQPLGSLFSRLFNIGRK